MSNAIGSDGIDPKFFKIIHAYLIPYITHIFNCIIMKSNFPENWKQAKIIPIPKSKNVYRPIAILPYLSKIFEKIINKQIRTYMTDNSMFSNLQSGFRPGHSCTTALQKVSEDLRSNMDSNKISLLILLDHTKAFDSVDHNMLSMKLDKLFKFSSQSVNLIRSYLFQRTQYVVVGNFCSEPLQVMRGVPQGSILGPLLYTLYSNDLPQCVKYATLHMYADDVQVYMSSTKSDLAENVQRLNSDLCSIDSWAKSNGLLLNASKSKCLVISSKNFNLPENINIHISNVSIDIVQQAKNLGIIFNDKLTWRDHIISAVGKTNAALRNVYVGQKFTPLNIRLTLAKTFLVPKLIYGCELFSSCSRDMMGKLNVTYNNIARYVFGLTRRDHVSEYAKRLFGVSFENLMRIRTLTSLHKIITTKSPQYLYNCLKFSTSPRNCHLIQIKHRKHLSDKFFFINAIRLWNLLPSNIQTITNDKHFKSELFNYYC